MTASLIEHIFREIYRDFYALPITLGGLTMISPDERCDDNSRSVRICEPVNTQDILTSECLQQRTIPEINREKSIIIEHMKNRNRIMTNCFPSNYSRRKVLRAGATPSHWRDIISISQSPNSVNELLSDKAGSRKIWPPILPVAHVMQCPRGG